MSVMSLASHTKWQTPVHEKKVIKKVFWAKIVHSIPQIVCECEYGSKEKYYY